jgi:hypothetical protein
VALVPIGELTSAKAEDRLAKTGFLLVLGNQPRLPHHMAADLLAGKSRQLLRRTVELHDPTLGVQDHDDRRDGLKHHRIHWMPSTDASRSIRSARCEYLSH